MTNEEFLAERGYLKYYPDGKSVAFLWEGGQYIGVYWADHLAINGLVDAVPFTVVNVHDQQGELSVTPDTWTGPCDEWLHDNENDLGGWLEHSL